MGTCMIPKTSQNQPEESIDELMATISSRIKHELDRQMTVSCVSFQAEVGKFQKTVSCDIEITSRDMDLEQEAAPKQQNTELRHSPNQSVKNYGFFRVKNMNRLINFNEDSEIESKANVGETNKEKLINMNHFSFQTRSLKPIYKEDDYILLNGVIEQRHRQLILGTLKVKQPIRLETIIFGEGQTYSGEWMAAKRHGSGRYVSARGTYDGEWAENKMNGKGVFTFSNKDRYQGEFKQGVMHGMGKMQQRSGSIYEGNFKAGKKDGNGIQVYDHGQYYEGQWKDGCKHGQGHLQFSDGSYCRGHFMENFIHGYAQYNWAGRKKYRGEWARNKSEGQGVMQWIDGRKYQGGYVNDKMQGRGVFTYPNGQVFSGIWRHNKKNGRGEYTDSTGKKIKGVWYEDRLIEEYVNI